jgi:hypothetical protein
VGRVTELGVPPEPLDLKSRIKALHRELEGVLGGRGLEAAIWAGMLLPSYLWEHWGGELSAAGVKWQDFLKVLKRHSGDVVAWALRDQLSWEELVRRVAAALGGSRQLDLTSFLRGPMPGEEGGRGEPPTSSRRS